MRILKNINLPKPYCDDSQLVYTGSRIAHRVSRMHEDRTRAVREILAFYVEAGVDDLINEEPVNHLAGAGAVMRSVPPDRPISAAPAAGAASLSAPLPLSGGGVKTPPPSPDAAVMAAREAARTAATLAELRNILENFTGCALKSTATQLVFADGNPEARIMFVGEAPGREEDLEGLPFVGRSGKLLDRMLAAIGLDRKAAYIANIVPWRPPGNRTPTPQEAAICLPFIVRQIELADPDLLVCVGAPSSQALLNLRDGMRKIRGRFFPYHTGTREIRAMPMFHPAYLLRSPLEKRWAWRDLLAIKAALDGPGRSPD
jgi:DNA polymerase